MVFGNSRGEFSVNRDLQERFCLLIERLGYDSYGVLEDGKRPHKDFVVRPYYWGDCECGWEDIECRLEHGDECYQAELHARMASYDHESGYTVINNVAFGHDDSPLAGFVVQTESEGPFTTAHHVDHELPLRGRRVSGLHVHTNLRVLPAEDNFRKGNR
jgi:hypothetical protein